MAFTVLFDANVLHPAGVRDLLIRLANTGLFRGRWSEQILDEMVASILRRRPDLAPDRLERTRKMMCEAVADCIITDYETLIDGLRLPDPDDRHVLAAALRCGAQVIVTANLKDFPSEKLDRFDIEAQGPDEFVFDLVGLAPARVASVVQQQAEALRRPPQTINDVLDTLSSQGLPRTAVAPRSALNG